MEKHPAEVFYQNVLESLFDKFKGVQTFSFIKKRPQHRCFPENIANFLRIAFVVEHFRTTASGHV